jgi:hypothetical protein
VHVAPTICPIQVQHNLDCVAGESPDTAARHRSVTRVRSPRRKTRPSCSLADSE